MRRPNSPAGQRQKREHNLTGTNKQSDELRLEAKPKQVESEEDGMDAEVHEPGDGEDQQPEMDTTIERT
jgi:hypothetical protein